MRDVHSQRDLRLSAVAAKVPLPNEDANQDANLQVAWLPEGCFTVRIHV